MADKALLLGINNYESISDLRGCVNDVADVSRILREVHDFSEANIRRHLNEEVTREQINDGFDWLVDDAEPGDRLVFHFSGHGSYIPSDDADEDVDELLCLYDMDWSNPESFLLDDDLGKLTRKVPAGVRLTVILDSCHSGTGTKALFERRSPKSPLLIVADTARKLESHGSEPAAELLRGEVLARLRQDEEPRVLARFVEPPQRFRRPRNMRVRRFGRALKAELNHQLLAAARDDQTAADAYIDGDFHGAFSYFLCKNVRGLGADATTGRVMEATIDAIAAAGHGQVPQSEGPFSNERIFGPFKANKIIDGGIISVEQVHGNGSVVAGFSEQHGAELLMNMLRVSEKFLDLADRFLMNRPGAAVVSNGGPKTRVGADVVVYVHGISRHTSGYSLAWHNAIVPHLSAAVERREVVWSDIVNRSVRVLRSPQEEQSRREIEMVLEDRLAQQAGQRDRGTGVNARAVRGSGFSIDDFLRYMHNEEERRQILARFDAQVRPLLQNGANVHIISHSWGTVVAYEGMRRLDNQSFSGRVENLFVVGSALSIRPVQLNLFGRVGDGRRPGKVERIINLDANGDIVGGRIGAAFTVAEEFLELAPVGCATFPFTNTAVNPSCAHSSYFNPQNLAVNRDIFARFLELVPA